MIWFTADLHFLHDKPFIYEPRGFDNIEEHDREIIRRWNKMVAPDDIVYVLGDIFMGTDYQKGVDYISQLNGYKHILRGNHDTDQKIYALIYAENTIIDGNVRILKITKKKRFYLCHYPTIVGNYDDTKQSGTWCLHGHTHSKDMFQHFDKKCINVGLDAHMCYPVSEKEVLTCINRRGIV